MAINRKINKSLILLGMLRIKQAKMILYPTK